MTEKVIMFTLARAPNSIWWHIESYSPGFHNSWWSHPHTEWDIAGNLTHKAPRLIKIGNNALFNDQIHSIYPNKIKRFYVFRWCVAHWIIYNDFFHKNISLRAGVNLLGNSQSTWSFSRHNAFINPAILQAFICLFFKTLFKTSHGIKNKGIQSTCTYNFLILFYLPAYTTSL